MHNLEHYLSHVNVKSRVILVLGEFDLLHPGHIRLLKFAKECGDLLIVGVNDSDDYPVSHRMDVNHRLEVVQSINCVDFAFINKTSAINIIGIIKPWAVVKGNEFEQLENPELSALKAYDGKLIFGSGELLSTKSSLFTLLESKQSSIDFSELKPYAERHQIIEEDINNFLIKIESLKVVVLGEVIVDEYVQGTAIGMSQEDPTIVMTPTENNLFLGGAAITASHIKAIGAQQVDFISIVGEDESAQFVRDKCNEYQINASLFKDYSRSTPLKTRYRVGNKTLLRVNKLRQHKISQELQKHVLNQVKTLVKTADILVFSDFNYGMLPQSLVNEICELCQQHQVVMVADSQTSSQLGDISRFNKMLLVTPTEREVRVALNNNDDGLVILANKLHQKSKAKNIAITLGDDGVFIHLPIADKNTWENDRIPALNNNAIDPAGGGDCFLATSSLMLAVGASPWHAYYMASIAAACQVERVGNRPLKQIKLKQLVKQSFN